MKGFLRLLVCLFLFLNSCRTVRSLPFFFFADFSDPNGRLIVDTDSNLFTSESGRQTNLFVRLNRSPQGTVRVGPIQVSDSTEGQLLSETFLSFDSSNWESFQSVTLKGADDSLSDGNVTYQVSFGNWETEDNSFKNQALPVVSVVNTDDETSGIAVSPSTGLLTSESGTQSKLSYVLQTKPMRTVTITGFTSSNTNEATPQNISLTFSPDNWDVPQSIMVTGVDDSTIDGPQNYIISAGLSTSADPSYQGKSVPVAVGTNTDNDAAGFTVVSLNTNTITEAGASTSFLVVLNTIPTSNVNISSMVASPATEAVVSPSSLTFTPSNWNVAQAVTVSGLDDFEADGNRTVTVVVSTASSGDANYNGLAGPSFPSITNTDDDTRGILRTPSTGNTISENGGSQIFSIQLNSRPPAGTTVTISGISSSNPSLISVTPATLVFDASNWSTPQTVTASAINNQIDEDTRSVTVSFGSIDTSSGSRDPGYDSVAIPSSVSLSVTDEDTAGFTVTPVSGLVVDENAGPISTTFTVVLQSQPTANVSIPSIVSSNTSEITVSPSNLTFTTSNWNTPQTVTLTSVIDGTLDGNIAVNITLASATSADPKYSGLTPSSVSATNIDSGAPQVILQNISSALNLPEDGTSTITFEIKLAILPGANVTIGPIVSSDTTEAVILDSSGNPTTSRTLVFDTTTNNAAGFTGSNSSGSWNMAQTITIRSVADPFDDGDLPVDINIPVASGSFYAGLRPTTVISGYTPGTGNLRLHVIDNDTKGFSISSTTVSVTEGGANGTFTVALTAAPCNTPGNLANCTAGSITIPLSSETFTAPDFTQYTFSPSSLTFDQTNWSTAQTVTIVPVDDAVDEIATRSHTLVLGAVSASGTDFDGFDPSDVTIQISDNDNPTARVTFALRTGSQAFTAENGLRTTYQIQLASQPLTGNSVSVTVATSDSTEGSILISTSPDVLANSNVYTFTSANWNSPVDVVIVGQSDADTSNTAYNITVGSGSETGSTASWYTGFTGATGTTAALINYDVGSNPITVATPASMTMAENAAAFNVFVFLSQAPTSNVTIPVSRSTSFPCRLMTSPSNVDQFSISTTLITITPANWNQSGTHNRITVTPNNDPVNDGNISCPIQIGWDGASTYTASADAFFNGFDPTDPVLTLNDNDTAGVVSSNLTPSPLVTSESGASASFGLNLASQPTANVTVSLTSNPSSIVNFSSTSLTFTPANYTTVQTVTITGQNIGTSGDQSYTISPSTTTAEVSTGGTGARIYDGTLTIASLSATNRELLYDIIPCTTAVAMSACGTSANASGGLVSSPSLVTTEAGGAARFQIRLRARPSSTVSFTISSSNTNEGSISPTSISFTTANWNTYQEVIITGVDDSVVDGTIAYQINFSTLSGGGTGFNGSSLPSVSISNTDNDTASVIVSPTAGLVTTEAGGTAQFTIQLSSQPTASVTIPLTSSNLTEGTVSPSTLVFDGNCPGANCWSTAQTVTITGVDDAVPLSGNANYQIITGDIVSTDPNYGAITGTSIPDVSVTNQE
ncbi:hypothetical protein LPTSP4_32600 [Leptospira ryugenii]|uniref:Calx-beta domain-containing protein n=1 Tax=Leptospira ryugenii TaxID=1917863 RepID=A0A2P2E4D0_9LEPT|nr:hypothetical protein [Leptospira ryugenii]GBF51722.1 hypothetical protein LPTSP4_32600 [Leptospira ryugenii]